MIFSQIVYQMIVNKLKKKYLGRLISAKFLILSLEVQKKLFLIKTSLYRTKTFEHRNNFLLIREMSVQQ